MNGFMADLKYYTIAFIHPFGSRFIVSGAFLFYLIYLKKHDFTLKKHLFMNFKIYIL